MPPNLDQFSHIISRLAAGIELGVHRAAPATKLPWRSPSVTSIAASACGASDPLSGHPPTAAAQLLISPLPPRPSLARMGAMDCAFVPAARPPLGGASRPRAAAIVRAGGGSWRTGGGGAARLLPPTAAPSPPCVCGGLRMLSSNELRPGTTVELDGTVWRVTEFLHVKPGKGAAFVRTKLKNLETGAALERTFKVRGGGGARRGEDGGGGRRGDGGNDGMQAAASLWGRAPHRCGC